VYVLVRPNQLWALQGFGGKTRGRGDFEYLGVVGRIILEWVFKKYDGRSVEWVDLAQDRDK
jgi:hypothetical protein